MSEDGWRGVAIGFLLCLALLAVVMISGTIGYRAGLESQSIVPEHKTLKVFDIRKDTE